MSERIVTIEKLDPVKVRQEKLPFTIHMNYVLQNVRHPLALAIWVYLTSLPDDWKVHRTQLMEHFDVGRDKLADALKYMNENKLIDYIQEKQPDGKFNVSHIVVKSGYEFEVIHRNDTAPLKNRNTVLPDNGETATTNKIINTNKTYNTKVFIDQKQNKPVDNLRGSKLNPLGNPAYDQKPVSQTNGTTYKKPDSGFADVSKQSNSYTPQGPSEWQRDTTTENYQGFKSLLDKLNNRQTIDLESKST